MRDAQHKPATVCDACAAAERNPLSGLYRTGCPECWARHVAALPTQQRRTVLDAMTDETERRDFVGKVRAAWERRSNGDGHG